MNTILLLMALMGRSPAPVAASPPLSPPKVTCLKAIPVDTRKPPFTDRLICLKP